MKYLIFVCVDGSVVLTAEEEATMAAGTDSWVREMDGRKVRLVGSQLQPVGEANTVRVRNGEVLVAEGPFAETKEHIDGFDIIECADLDEAIEVASKHPVAPHGTIEVRPFWQP
ncbi:YciI family protein [Salinispora cortesiana]|uniref:YciI family protein n=1 Tax=Salinispora cortesiana TaxID=1305843 RepID=UPI00046E7AEA